MGTAVAKQDYHIVDALNADWDQLKGGHHKSVGRWSAEHLPLAGCADLEDVLRSVRRDPDPVLLALLTESAAGEELAGRVVMQAMLGRVVKMAGRDGQGSVDDYVVAMWFRIRTYPLERRAARISANLALDTLKSVTDERAWARSAMTVVLVNDEVELDQFQSKAVAEEKLDHGADYASLTASSVIYSADRLGLIDDLTRQVMLSVYADGLTGRAAAQRHGTTPAMIRYRCSRAVRRLARDPTSLAFAA